MPFLVLMEAPLTSHPMWLVTHLETAKNRTILSNDCNTRIVIDKWCICSIRNLPEGVQIKIRGGAPWIVQPFHSEEIRKQLQSAIIMWPAEVEIGRPPPLPPPLPTPYNLICHSKHTLKGPLQVAFAIDRKSIRALIDESKAKLRSKTEEESNAEYANRRLTSYAQTVSSTPTRDRCSRLSSGFSFRPIFQCNMNRIQTVTHTFI